VLPPSKLFLEEFGWFPRLVGWIVGTPIPPTAWDWLFNTAQADGRFVIVTFEDGHQVAGEYSRPSIAITSPEPQGIFIAKEWLIDAAGDLERVRPGSRGILIPSLAGIRSIRILESEDDWSAEIEGGSDGEEAGRDQGRGSEQGRLVDIGATEEVQHEASE
jgi:hypothetical protein